MTRSLLYELKIGESHFFLPNAGETFAEMRERLEKTRTYITKHKGWLFKFNADRESGAIKITRINSRDEQRQRSRPTKEERANKELIALVHAARDVHLSYNTVSLDKLGKTLKFYTSIL